MVGELNESSHNTQLHARKEERDSCQPFSAINISCENLAHAIMASKWIAP